MTNPDQQVLEQIRAHIAAFPADRQQVIHELARQVREISQSEAGAIALALVGAEHAAAAEG